MGADLQIFVWLAALRPVPCNNAGFMTGTFPRLEAVTLGGREDMSHRNDRDGDWRVEFIQPVTPHDDRCIMLYGREGEIVGPLTMQLAEAWIDHFDNARHEKMLRQRLEAGAGSPG
jgi:hypothetical protein